MKKQRDVSVRDGTGPRSPGRVTEERERRLMKRVAGGRNGG